MRTQSYLSLVGLSLLLACHSPQPAHAPAPASAVPAASEPAQTAPSLPTPLEANGFTRISTSAEISAWLDRLVAAAPVAHKVRLGESAQGRAIEALVFSAAPDAAAEERFTILVTGTQHGAAEPAGGEALLVLARELAFGDLRPLVDAVDIVLVPNANPDGRDLGRRSNAHRVNINTDFVIVAEPETRVLKQALLRLAPDVVLDSHESAVLKRKTLALEGYLTDFEAQVEIANTPGVPTAIRRLSEDVLLPALIAAIDAGGLRADRYIGEITSTHQPITNGGLTLRNFRNTAGVSGAVSFLVETKLDSRDDPHPTWRNIGVRVERQLVCLRAFLRLAHARRAEIQAALAAPVDRTFPLYSGYRVDPAHPRVQIPLRRIATRELELLEFRDHRRVELADPIDLPDAYLVTDAIGLLRPLLEIHGIGFRVLDAAQEFDVVANRFAPQPNITERVETLASATRRLRAPAGSLWIDLAQPRGRSAVLLLDPRSTSSVFRYPQYAALIQPDRDHFAYPVLGEGRTAPRGPGAEDSAPR